MSSDYDKYLLCKIGNLLSTSNELIQNILKELSYRDLVSAAQVSVHWNCLAKNIFRNRRQFRYITNYPNGLPTTESSISPSIEACCSPKTTIKEFVEQLSIQPTLCLAFTIGEWLVCSDINVKSSNGSTLLNFIKTTLPSNCHIGLVSAEGVIGSIENSAGLDASQDRVCKRDINKTAESQKLNCESASSENCSRSSAVLNGASKCDNLFPNLVDYSIEVEECHHDIECNSISLLFVPQLPKVRMNIIPLNHKNLKQRYSTSKSGRNLIEISDDDFNSLCNLSPKEDIKALILIGTNDDKSIETFLNVAVNRQNYKLALGGAYVQEIQPAMDSFALVVSGDHVLAASIIIPSSVKNAEALEPYMQSLKECGLPEQHSFALMFACCGRGSHWYKRNNNVETKAFRKSFPQTPVFGLFGGGEIGLNYLPVVSNWEVTAALLPSKKPKKKLFYSYSTVIVLFSFL